MSGHPPALSPPKAILHAGSSFNPRLLSIGRTLLRQGRLPGVTGFDLVTAHDLEGRREDFLVGAATSGADWLFSSRDQRDDTVRQRLVAEHAHYLQARYVRALDIEDAHSRLERLLEEGPPGPRLLRHGFHIPIGRTGKFPNMAFLIEAFGRDAVRRVQKAVGEWDHRDHGFNEVLNTHADAEQIGLDRKEMRAVAAVETVAAAAMEDWGIHPKDVVDILRDDERAEFKMRDGTLVGHFTWHDFRIVLMCCDSQIIVAENRVFLKGQSVPDTILLASGGHRLGELIEHKHLPANLTVERAHKEGDMPCFELASTSLLVSHNYGIMP